MRHLLVVAHGSRRQTSNEEVRRLAADLGPHAVGRFDGVGCAFLEIAEPSIPDGIEAAVRAGATDLVVMPYFLSAGRHVAKDIPREVASKQAEYPQVRMRIAPHLGLAPGVSDILLDLAGAERL
jgi:sirohydrochlorin ferrochelatase